MNAYLAKIDILISRIKQETDINSISDPLKKADIIFGWLQSNTNEGTYNDCYDFRDTLNLKVGNCLSYAIRFTTVCRHFGVDIKASLSPDIFITCWCLTGRHATMSIPIAMAS